MGRRKRDGRLPLHVAEPMNLCLGILLLAACIVLVSGCASRRAMRPTMGQAGDPPDSVKKSEAWYIESTPQDGQRPVSCSFVEFDERGDYLDFQQHRRAYMKMRELSAHGERLFVVIFVHGWKNNSQSGNVVDFNNFLRQLASSELAKSNDYRVYGIYISWRGNVVQPSVDTQSSAFTNTRKAFGDSILDPHRSRNGPFGWLFWLPEQLSYWDRKGAAENRVSRVPLARTIFTCAHSAKRYNKDNRVFLMGHSFGALMLEQSVLPATLAQLTDEWPLDDPQLLQSASANPLPFDLIMLVNSAAPSIYAKEFYGYMAAHRAALKSSKVPGADAPIVISLTSTADCRLPTSMLGSMTAVWPASTVKVPSHFLKPSASTDRE